MERIKNFNRQEITRFINENGFKNTSIVAETDKWLIVKCMDVEELYKLFDGNRKIANWCFLSNSNKGRSRKQFFYDYVFKSNRNQYFAFNKRKTNVDKFINSYEEYKGQNDNGHFNVELKDKNYIIGFTVIDRCFRSIKGQTRITNIHNRLNDCMFPSYFRNRKPFDELNDIVEKFNL